MNVPLIFYLCYFCVDMISFSGVGLINKKQQNRHEELKVTVVMHHSSVTNNFIHFQFILYRIILIYFTTIGHEGEYILFIQ